MVRTTVSFYGDLGYESWQKTRNCDWGLPWFSSVPTNEYGILPSFRLLPTSTIWRETERRWFCVCGMCVCERENVFGTERQSIKMLSYPLFLMAALWRRRKHVRNFSGYFIKGRNSYANIRRATLGLYSHTSLIFTLVGLQLIVFIVDPLENTKDITKFITYYY